MNNNYWIANGIFYNSETYDFKDKTRNVSMYINYMLNRTRHIFKYKNLPETLDERMLELYIQVNGFAGVTKVNGNLYAFFGGLGGEPNPYYMPTIFTVANPALNYSKNLKINEDCVIIPNDSTYMGMLPMFRYYATLDVETDISFNRMLINMRKINVFSAMSDRTSESAKEYIKKIENGDDSVIAEQGLVESLRVQPGNTAEKILTDLIEFKQYNKASWFNFIGLDSNYNMKRESLNSNETQLNEDMLFPMIDDMLEMRQKAIEKINEMYGTEIEVELASTWELNKIESDIEIESKVEEITKNDENTQSTEEIETDDNENNIETSDEPTNENIDGVDTISSGKEDTEDSEIIDEKEKDIDE